MKKHLVSLAIISALSGCIDIDGNAPNVSNPDPTPPPTVPCPEGEECLPDIGVNPPAPEIGPPIVATYTAKLMFEGKQLLGDISCEGQTLNNHGEFSFTAHDGEASVQCNFGAIANLATLQFQFSDLLGKGSQTEQEYIRHFDLKQDGDLNEHSADAFALLGNISTCKAEPYKLCLDEIDSYDIASLYRSGDRDAIDAFLNPVVAEEGEQPSAHVDPNQKPVVTPGAGNNLSGGFVAADAEASYEYVPAAESKPMSTARLLDRHGQPLVGIEYFSQSANGITGSEGQFEYLWGENLIFGIDTFTLGEVKGNKFEYRLADLSDNELVQQNLEALVERYGIGTNEAASAKVRDVFAQYPNVINELVNLNLPNGAIIQDCFVAGVACTMPNGFTAQFEQGLTLLIDEALKLDSIEYHQAPRVLRAGAEDGAYVTQSLKRIFNDVENVHIFHDNVAFYGASGYARGMRNFNLTNEAFPVLMPRNDNNYWLPFGSEAAWTRGAGVDKKAYFVDATLLEGDASIEMVRPDLISKESATYNMPTMAAGLIGQGKVVFLGNVMYTAALACPDNYWAYGDLKVDVENQVCRYRTPDNADAELNDVRNDHGSMKTFFGNLITWLAPSYANGSNSIDVASNLSKSYPFGYPSGYDFFIDAAYNIGNVVSMSKGGFSELNVADTPVLLLQSFEIQMYGDGMTNKLLSNPDKPVLTEADVTALIQYVNEGGNIIVFDTLEASNPAPIARLADAAGVSIGGANVVRTLQTNCGESYYCPGSGPNLHAVNQHDIVVYERYAKVGGSDGIGLDAENGSVIWPSDVAMMENPLEIAKYTITTTDKDGNEVEQEKLAFEIVKSDEEKQAAIAKIQAAFPDVDVPVCQDAYPYEVNCIEVRPGHGIPSRGNYSRPDFQRMPMSNDVVDSMVKAANLGDNIDRLLNHELYFRTKGKTGARLSKVELTATYDNLSVWMWNDTQYEYVEDAESGDELGFKRAVEMLNCYTSNAHGGGSLCQPRTQALLRDPDGNPDTDDAMVNLIGELDPQFPLNWMEKPLTRIMLGRSFWDHDIVVDVDGYLQRPSATGANEEALVHTHGTTVTGTAGNMQSTGLWAPQLQQVTVSGGVKANITVALVDDITGRAQHELALKRPSRVQQSFRHDGGSTQITVPYGGLIYIQPLAQGTDDLVSFQFSNVLKASLWRDGQWLHPYNPEVPLAEIDTGHFIYTTPVNNVSGNAEVIKQFVVDMNAFAESASDFYGREQKTAQGDHRRFTYTDLPGNRHRFVNDAQISIGAAHSGYPVQSSSFNVNSTSIPTVPTNDWLLWHEVGHNLAAAPFTITGATEVTNNILALYMQEQRQDKPYMERIEATLPKIKPWLQRHHGHGWSQGDNGMRLAMFGQLKLWGEDHFKIADWYPDAADRPSVFGDDEGWNMIKLAHRKAREHGDAGNQCSATQTGLSQGDLLMTCLSYLTHTDLTDYFRAWNPSESKADLPPKEGETESQVSYSGGLTAAGLNATQALGFNKPNQSPFSYTSVQ
ncbi:SslE/AcfD family lipoprotein zinc metalloprotease [Ferrimonas senticii]|uniref:SslE/AcfD family lipoprotein zinc metalloprotease n=1 Tax=Ferrimonas senticii TaxID=394566 RepID=UPI00040DBEC2|nr:SslE/AcfD family lipoprotein zinc metalloprotease [Ferrimonas senticii]